MLFVLCRCHPFCALLAQVTRVDARKLSLKVDTTEKSPVHLRNTLSVLSRTRESLSKSGCFSSLPGQVLEKVLGKQINSRLGELSSSSSSPLLLQDVPVAIRNSTPVSFESIEEPNDCFPEELFGRFNPVGNPCKSSHTAFAPEDKNLPLNNFLRDISSQENHGNSLTSNCLEPTVPWSPLKSSGICDYLNKSSNILEEENIQSPSSFVFFDRSFSSLEYNTRSFSKVEEMDDARLDCQIKIAHLKNLIQQYNPTNRSQATIL